MTTLMRLAMFSQAAFPLVSSSSELETDLLSILSQSQRSNLQHGLTGVLYYGNGYFVHYLEGEQSAMTAVMTRMALDTRHRNLEVVWFEPIEQRRFSQWRMRFLQTDRRLAQLLKKHEVADFQPYEFSLDLLQDLIDAAAEPDYQRCA